MAAARQASLSITNSWSLLKLISNELVMPSSHLILSCALLLLPPIFYRIRIFSNKSVLHIRWPKYWSFSFSISASNEYSGLISFRIDWLDLLAPRTSKEFSPTPQFRSINSSALSFLYGPTLMFVQYYWKNHSFHHTNLCWQTDVSAFQHVVSVCHSFPSEEQASFNSTVSVTVHSDFGAQENKSCHVSTFSLSIFHEVVGPDVVISVF